MDYPKITQPEQPIMGHVEIPMDEERQPDNVDLEILQKLNTLLHGRAQQEPAVMDGLTRIVNDYEDKLDAAKDLVKSYQRKVDVTEQRLKTAHALINLIRSSVFGIDTGAEPNYGNDIERAKAEILKAAIKGMTMHPEVYPEVSSGAPTASYPVGLSSAAYPDHGGVDPRTANEAAAVTMEDHNDSSAFGVL